MRAERKVEGEIGAEFRRVHGKNGILVKLATAALALPEEIVRKALYPVVGRRTLEDIIAAVAFGCGNEVFRPVMDALALLQRYADSEEDFYAAADVVPLEHVVPEDWREAVIDPDTGLVERIPYELCVLVALRKAIRRREIWVEGGNTWRNPGSRQCSSRPSRRTWRS